MPNEDRDIAVSIILTLITCGLYGLYWLAVINDELNARVMDYEAPSGGVVVLLSIVTCGIYELYWFYKAGEKVTFIKQQRGEFTSGNESIVYLVIDIFAMAIINYALIQSELNKSHPRA